MTVWVVAFLTFIAFRSKPEINARKICTTIDRDLPNMLHLLEENELICLKYLLLPRCEDLLIYLGCYSREFCTTFMHALILDNRDNLEPLYYFIINANTLSFDNERFYHILELLAHMQVLGLAPF